jgi:hypothetical protein
MSLTVLCRMKEAAVKGAVHAFRIAVVDLIHDRLVPEQEDGEEEAGQDETNMQGSIVAYPFGIS